MSMPGIDSILLSPKLVSFELSRSILKGMQLYQVLLILVVPGLLFPEQVRICRLTMAILHLREQPFTRAHGEVDITLTAMGTKHIFPDREAVAQAVAAIVQKVVPLVTGVVVAGEGIKYRQADDVDMNKPRRIYGWRCPKNRSYNRTGALAGMNRLIHSKTVRKYGSVKSSGISYLGVS